MQGGKLQKILSIAGRAGVFTLDGLNRLIWPPVCDNCGLFIDETDNYLCRNCWQELLSCAGGDYCRRCGRDASKYAMVAGACPNCLGEDICFDGLARTGVYSGALRRMILSFKGSDRVELDRHLSLLANSALQGGGFYTDIDVFVPVPLHWRRRFARGYNQAAVIAAKLEHPTAVVSTDIVRMRNTKAQATLNPAKRASNVAGAFAVRRDHKFSGKRLCLVDDIKTTGATLNECARTLKSAGAAKVYALVLAVAGRDNLAF